MGTWNRSPSCRQVDPRSTTALGAASESTHTGCGVGAGCIRSGNSLQDSLSQGDFSLHFYTIHPLQRHTAIHPKGRLTPAAWPVWMSGLSVQKGRRRKEGAVGLCGSDSASQTPGSGKLQEFPDSATRLQSLLVPIQGSLPLCMYNLARWLAW